MTTPGGPAAPSRRLGVLDLDALLDRTRCPSCGAPLRSPACHVCGADLTGATARSVWEVSQRLVTTAGERATLVERLRGEAAQRRAAAAMAPVAPSAVPQAAVPQAAVPQAAVPQAAVPPPAVPPPAVGYPTVPPPPPGADAPARPRLGVQGVLVGLGALLIAVAAVVFLVFAWDTLGIAGRAAVVGGVTVAALGGAAFLRPRLEATAEAVGGLAAVLVLADVWAVRRTGLGGADRVDAGLYTGAGLAVAVVVLLAWGLLAKVRAGTVVATAVAPVAAFFLGRAAMPTSSEEAAFAVGALLAALLPTARGLLPDRLRAERVVGRVWSAAALPVTLVALPLTYDERAWTAVLVGAGAVVAAGLASVADRPSRWLMRVWSAASGVFLAGTVVAAGVTLVDEADGRDAWLLPAASVAVGAALLLVAATAPLLRRAGVAVRAVALAVEGVGVWVVLAAGGAAAGAAAHPVVTAVARPWRAEAGTALSGLGLYGDPTDAPWWDAATLLGACAALVVLALGLVGSRAVRPDVVRSEAQWLAPLLVGAAVVGALATPRLAVVASVLGLAAVAVVTTVLRVRVPALGRAGRPAGSTRVPPVEVSLRLVAAGAGVLAVVDAWNVPALSVPMTVAGALALLAARPALAAGPALVAASGTAFAVASGGAAGLLGLPVADRVTVAGLVGCLLVAAGAALAVAVRDAGRPARLLAAPTAGERLALVGAGTAVVVVALLAALGGDGGAEPAEPGRLALLLGALLVAVVAVAVAPAGASAAAVVQVSRAVRVAAAGGVPVVAAGAALAAVARFTESDLAVLDPSVVLAAVAAVAAIALAGLVALRPATLRDPRRTAVEVGSAVVAAASLLVLGAGDTSSVVGGPSAADDLAGRAWIVLLLLGAGVAAVAAAPDRRELGWGAWLLLSGSSAVRLGLADVGVVEAYTLPPAAALLAVAALRLRRERRSATGERAPVWRVLGPGAGLALGPSILASASGSPVRPAVLVGVGAVLVALASGPAAALRHRLGVAAAVLGAAAAGGAGLLRPVAATVRLTGEVTVPAVDPVTAVEVWSVPAGLVVLAAVVVLAVRHPGLTAKARGAALLPGLLVLTAPTWFSAAVSGDGVRVAPDDGAAGTAWVAVRLGAAFAVLAAAAVAAAARREPAGAQRRPVEHLLTHEVMLAAPAGAALVALTAWRVLDRPVEVFSAATGGLLVVLGALRLLRRPALRSWPALGPGLLLALVPTLLLSPGETWRVVALTVVGAGVLAVGAARRLQAPVVVAGVVLATHAVVQLAPYLARVTTSQWRWAVFAVVGLALLVLGATYERQIVRLRAARTRVLGLR